MQMLPRALAFAALIALACPAAAATDNARWEKQAAGIRIVRDDWGIAHVHGKTDADAVFGMVYAQAEDDFNRVETNYINAMGRLAEAEGEKAIWQDLRMKIFIDPADLKADYARSPAWLKTLMTAWADGLNYYLATHPKVTPKVIKHFEPWMALSFTEGSIGGDIESVSLSQLEAFYGGRQTSMAQEQFALAQFKEPSGSNGFAIAPGNTAAGHALLLINPHTSFFFRSEQQVSSDAGLNVYGAATWGQFFIYQGFNAKAGWMHTTSGLDSIDEFAETIAGSGDKLTYRYGTENRPVTTSVIAVPYRAADGSMKAKSFTVYRTHHGPIVREAGGKWIAVALMNKPIAALSQSYLRTKAVDYASYMKVMAFKANSSNNTLFADAKGEVAYLHPQFIPKRDDRFDYTKPVDGSDPATDWKGLHALTEAPHLLNPANGWIANTNNWPYSAAGAESPKKADYPRYMDSAGENPRGIHANLVLKDRKDFTLPTLIAAAYDPRLTAFDQLIPPLIAAYDATPAISPLKGKLADQVALLRGWDHRWSATSEATSLAVFWGEQLWSEVAVAARAEHRSVYDDMVSRTTPDQKLTALAVASDRLAADFGTWRTPWGEINRFQRLTGELVQPFNDAGPSIPVPFASAQWGSLASFGAGRKPGTKKYYGTSGNSFVAVVEFGDKVHARAVTAGGESGDPASKHFNDQAGRYSTGDLREVYFYPEQLTGHTESSYRPGQ
ncbi:penicillin acylase family protein [Phenylobacterium sp. 20VBR1]|uniref:Penicillin acylase family protein n=1 Tax=Phenylobacterium glaciei TaxID=2803784 RepID=A0A941D086_9CAUL|nr:penicillin acylase family protein [Phenylobacterium glaciei]MBR7618508.1 penicillin acylase family protein [Phenylobacterium glaciei]